LPNIQTQTLAIPQSTIRVEIEYYSKVEKGKLLNYPSAAEIQALVANGIDIPMTEFLTYYLFHRRRPGKPGWQDYDQIARRIGIAITHIDEWIDFNGTSISWPVDVGHQEHDITEHIGESIGLSVIGRLHGLTVMDWDRIPEQHGPNALRTFDYQLASDGRRVVQLEAKGSATSDNTVLTSAVRSHRQNITDKKTNIIKNRDYPYPADLRYGTITVLGQNAISPVKCLLVDPEPEGNEERARKLRLVQRMRFLRDWIVFVSPRSQLASALNTRLASLEELEDPFQLNGIPLRKGNGEFFDYDAGAFFLRGHSSFFANKSRITDGPAGGITIQLPDGNFFLLGIREELLELAANQELDNVLEYKTESGSITKEVVCFFNEGRFRLLSNQELLANRAERIRGYYSLRVRGRIHYSDSGILYGVLPIRQ